MTQVTAERGIKQRRIMDGLCPICGKEAAPYYLCADHRFRGKIDRILRRASKAGALKVEKRGRDNYYSLKSDAAFDSIKWRPDPKEGDGRLRPRLGRVPVNVEHELIRLMQQFERPVTVDEITSAWGRLREKRKGTLVGDMSSLIQAQRRREAKNAKRLAKHGESHP